MILLSLRHGGPTSDRRPERKFGGGAGVRVMSAVDRRFLLLTIILALIGGPARAQNLDQGKSGATLFAATCADCHHSSRGLAKGRLSWTLSHFLQQHYTSSAASAQTLTAYLQSVDTPPAKPQSAAGKSRPTAPAASAPSSLRPPAAVPKR